VFGSWLHRNAWRTMITAYIFISAAQREVLAPVGLPVDRSFVKHNFVPAPPVDTKITKEPQVAYVGRLDEAKGAPFLMRAWDAFRVRHPRSPLRLVIVGGGDMVDEVNSWATQHESVTVVGHVQRSQVYEILAQSRAVVVPSQWEETFGMAAVEAMAVATAPVASAHGAFPELVTNGSDGALFAPTDIDGLVEVLTDIEDNPRRWDRFGRQARQTYLSRFSADAGIDRLLEIYRFAVEHPLEESGRPEDIPGPYGRSSFGVPT
jgi:glycosyltransferase involved in cell wall biosynthesis